MQGGTEGSIEQLLTGHITSVNVSADPPAVAPSSEQDEDSEHDSGAQRKSRQNFSQAQLAILECVFQTSPLPRKSIRSQLAEQLGLPQRSVQVWFQNRCAPSAVPIRCPFCACRMRVASPSVASRLRAAMRPRARNALCCTPTHPSLTFCAPLPRHLDPRRRQKWRKAVTSHVMNAVQQQSLAAAAAAAAAAAGPATDGTDALAAAPAAALFAAPPQPFSTGMSPLAAAPAAAGSGSAMSASAAGGQGMAALKLRWQEQWGAHVQAQLALQQQQQQQRAASSAADLSSRKKPMPSGILTPCQQTCGANSRSSRESNAACEGLLLLSSCAQLPICAPASSAV